MYDTTLAGRSPLITDLTSIPNKEVLVTELERILPFFHKNQREIIYLQDYYKGYHQPIENRTKKVRSEINNRVTVNYAYSAVRDIVGYYLGKPIQYVHRDVGEEVSAKVSEFNRILDAENKNLVNTLIAQDQSICGVGFLGVFHDKHRKNGSVLNLKRLDPANTFVVKSSDPEVEEVYCVSFYHQQPDLTGVSEPMTVYTVWTQDRRYVIHARNSFGEFNRDCIESITEHYFSYGGYLPIQEYPNNLFRIGDFEPALSLMDAIDRAASNRDNDIEQTIQSILVAIGIDLTGEGVLETLEERGLLNVPNVVPDAHDPTVDYIGSALDPTIGDVFSQYLESCLNVVIGLPDRKTRGGGGGDTGTAVELRDGWMDIDLVASFKEGFFIKSDRNTLGAILYLLKINKDFDGLEVQDIEIKFSRNKTSNIQSKSQALGAFLGSGISPQDAVEWCDLTTDVLAVVQRMEQYRLHKEDLDIAFAERERAIATPAEETNEDEEEFESANQGVPIKEKEK